MEWQGKNALVIGANGGIGREFVRKLLERNANVYGTYRRSKPDLLPDNHLYQLDLEKGLSELESTIEKILSSCQPDVVILAAGSAYYGSFTNMDVEDIQHIYQVDLIAPAIISKSVLQYLKNKGGGHYHIVAAIAGLVPAIKNMTVYSSAKFGLVGLVRSLAMECVGTPVRVSVSCPAGVLTDLPKNAHGETESFLKIIENLKKNFEDPAEVVEGILRSLESREVVILPTEKAKSIASRS